MSRQGDPCHVDALILGGGIGGATVAANLAPSQRLILFEREPDCGYHTTGRSAAMFLPSYGAASVRPLTQASRGFLEAPPQGFGGALLRPRDALHIARRDQLPRLEALAREIPSSIRLSGAAARERAPILRQSEVCAAVLETGAADIDVDRLHWGFLQQARDFGAQIIKSAGDVQIDRVGDLWHVRAKGRDFTAPILINATGAWADQTALAAGLEPKGLQPLRRTVVLVDSPARKDFHDWPIVKDVDERFYFRPFAGQLLITPADETPSPACDAWPDALDVATAMMRFHDVALHPVRTVRHQWAGLRTFAADRAPVIGWDRDGFFWFAGLGGFGIQTAAAAGRLAAGLILNGSIPAELADAGVDPAAFDPRRPNLHRPQTVDAGTRPNPRRERRTPRRPRPAG